MSGYIRSSLNEHLGDWALYNKDCRRCQRRHPTTVDIEIVDFYIRRCNSTPTPDAIRRFSIFTYVQEQYCLLQRKTTIAVL